MQPQQSQDPAALPVVEAVADAAAELAKLKQRLERERRARLQAEAIAEKGLRDLYEKQRQLELLEAVAVAANQASSIKDAFQFAVTRVCAFTEWALGHAYLIPYGKEVQLITGYKGLITLAYRSAEVSHISANVVYEKDIFECVLGTIDKIHHVPFLGGDRGAPIAVYAVAHFKGRENYPAIEVLSPKDVAAAHAAHIPLPFHAPRSKVAEAYAALAEEVRGG